MNSFYSAYKRQHGLSSSDVKALRISRLSVRWLALRCSPVVTGSGFPAPAPPADKLQQQTREPIRVVARNPVLRLKQRSADRKHPEGPNLCHVVSDGLSLFSGVPPPHPNWERTVVQDSEVKNISPDVLDDGLKVFSTTVTSCLSGLCHQVTNEDSGSLRVRDLLRNSGNQQVREQRGVQGSRPHRDQIGFCDGLESLRHRTAPRRHNRQLADGHSGVVNLRFSLRAPTVSKQGSEADIRKRCGEYFSPHRQHFTRQPDRQ